MNTAGQTLTESLLQAAWDSAVVPESGEIEPGQRYLARSGGGYYYTAEAATRMACQGAVHERRLLQ